LLGLLELLLELCHHRRRGRRRITQEITPIMGGITGITGGITRITGGIT
jgi:hypothetical protein